MKNIKSSITRLIRAIESKLQDKNDLFGYAGIERQGLISSLQESYNLLDELEKRKETFEVILLKRTLAELLRKANNFLTDQLDTDKASEKFNDFINRIADVKYSVKKTYLLIVEDSIRVESDIIESKRQLEELSKLTSEYSELKDEVQQSYSQADTQLKSISSFLDTSKQNDQSISDLYEDSSEKSTQIQTYAKNTQEWNEEIDSIVEEIRTQNLAYKDNQKNFEELSEKLKQIQVTTESQQKKLEEQAKTAKEQQTEIQKTIEDANRASMAGSFKKRKDELNIPIRNSELVMNGTLIIIAAISFYLLIDSGLGTTKFDYISFFSRFTVVAPLIWIAWSSAKKLGHLVRIREDYAYKYASAMAYEGYRKQAEDIDNNLLLRLLHVSIENMGNNPIRLFDSTNNHASPFHEATDKLGETVKPIFSKNKSKSSTENEDE